MEQPDRNSTPFGAAGTPADPAAARRVAVVWLVDALSEATELVSQLRESEYHIVELTDLGAVMALVQGGAVEVVVAVRGCLRPTEQEHALRRRLAARHPNVCLIEARSCRAQPAGQPHTACQPSLVLVADDDEQVRHMFEAALHRRGYRTMVAENGKAAMSLLADFGADVLITDIVMPDQDGLETIRSARQLLPALKIMAVTGASGEYLDVARMLGADATLAKPVGPRLLADTVDKLLA